MDNVEKQINSSFKWSTVTEIVVKLISPILNAILARILLPEDFAPLTTITMIVSFCEVFIESGFKKVLIQRDLGPKEEQEYFDVAFWASLSISLLIWGGIAGTSKLLAQLLKSPNLWIAIIISGIILPMYSVVGIFGAKIQKKLLFKKLFWVRMITALIPLVVTIPLALLGLSYWALIVGNIASVFAQMVVICAISHHRVRIYFSFNILKDICSNGIWTMLDGVAVWFTAWIDSLLIATYMSDYYLGLYKNSLSTVTSLFGIVSAAVIPVLFVGLSKYQHDHQKFSNFFNNTQRRLALILIPLGVGVCIYSDVAVSILFGNQWKEAAGVVGITALTVAVRTVFVSINNDAFRAKARFKLPLFLQVSDNIVLIPLCVFSARRGFWMLVYMRAIARLFLIVPEMIIMRKVLHIDVVDQIKKLIPIFISTLIMAIACTGLRCVSHSFIWSMVSVALAIAIYMVSLMIFPSSREDLKEFIRMRR